MTEPWLYDTSEVPWDLPKKDYVALMRRGMTDHRFISLCEGNEHGLRVNAANPATTVAGIIADYDGIVPGEFDKVAAAIMEKAPSGYLPAWASESKSGKMHLVWLFAEPLRISDTDHAKRFLHKALKKINADQWAAGLELKSTLDPTVYIDIGKRWVPMAPAFRIAASILNMWNYELFCETLRKDRKAFGPSIPMRDLQTEAKARGWQGVPLDFEAGKHSRRFWSADSDNDRGCMITEAGVLVFVQEDKPFMSWSDIFGREFVERYSAAAFTADTADLWWSGKQFWMKENDGVYREQALTDLNRKLRCNGLAQTIARGETASEIDKFLMQVQDEHKVASAECWMYYKPGLRFRENGERILNISQSRVTEPAPPCTPPEAKWENPDVRNSFPFLHGLITHMFQGPVPQSLEGDPSQIDRFIWWLAHFYKSSYYYKPEPGQALFIAGKPGTGKSFLCRHVLPPLMGGVAADASQHLTGGQQWTSQLIDKPFLNVDDDANINQATHARYCQLVKKYVANSELENQQKYRDVTAVPWYGRIIVSCNLDQNSLAVIPDLSQSNRDKVTILRATAMQEYRGFKSFERNREYVRDELPMFASYLLNLKIPEKYQDPNKRFGVVSWQHPVLLEQAEASDCGSAIVEILAATFSGDVQSLASRAIAARAVDPNSEACYWTGMASQLMKLIGDMNPTNLREIRDIQALGTALRTLSDRGWDVTALPMKKGGSKLWRIAYDLLERGMDPTRVEQR